MDNKTDHIEVAQQKLAQYQLNGISIEPWRSWLRTTFKQMMNREIKSTGPERLNHLDVIAIALPSISIPITSIRMRCPPFEWWLAGNCEQTYRQRVNDVKQGRTAEWRPLVVEDNGDGIYNILDGHHRLWALMNEGLSDSMVKVVIA